MCKAMEDYKRRNKVIGAIELMQSMNASDEDIIAKVMNLFGVNRQFVLELLSPEKA